MSAWCRIGVTAALSLILSAAAARSHGRPISVSGGHSTIAGAWQMSPDSGITHNVTWANSTGLTTFENASDVLASPPDTGVDYTSPQFGVAASTVKCTESQIGDASDWDTDDGGDDLPASADPSTVADDSSDADLTLQQSPEAIVSEVVDSPLAVWLSLAGLLSVVVLTIRTPKATKPRG